MQTDRDNVIIMPVIPLPRPLPVPANDNAWPVDEEETYAYERDPFSDLFDDDYNECIEQWEPIEDGSNILYPDFGGR